MKKKRMIAFGIDIITIAILMIIIMLCFIPITIPNKAMAMSMFATMLIICKDCYNGTSIGKYIMNIQIKDIKSRKPASPLKCVIRNYMYFLGIVEVAIFLCSKNSNRIGGHITQTIVEENIEKNGNIIVYKILISIAIVIVIFIGIYFSMGLNPYPSLIIK